MIKKFKYLVLATALVAEFSHAQEFSLTSTSIQQDATLSNEQVFNGFGCAGENISPDLTWTKGLEGTKSYAVTVYDPDAPTGSGWWHWLVYNIPAAINTLKKGAGREGENTLPKSAVQGRSDFGSYSFGGACPPEGDEPHHYIFTVHALKTEKMDLPKDASAALIGYMINANAISKATLTATYAREKPQLQPVKK